ncbi:MAG TPA: TRAP transporter small permease subunit [Spirochaetales bacterium]|nr:TRAP transporter small permease subunit [Spirochaetales bacterium]HOV38381.1 TRAP transporter small permease subunit [Spirochaetales bacterium]
MEKIISILKKISDFFEKVGIVISTLYCVVVFCMVFSGVFLRIIGKSLSWSEEVSRWLLISMAFVSSSVAMKRGMHVGITYFIRMVPASIMRFIIFVSNCFVMVFLIYGFSSSLRAALHARNQLGDIILIPMMYVKLNLPFGFFMMMVHLLYISFAVLKSDEPQNYMISS